MFEYPKVAQTVRLLKTTFWCCDIPELVLNPTASDLVDVDLPFSLDVERMAP